MARFTKGTREMANLFTRIGSDAAAFKAGQDRFSSGQRVEWRTR